MTSQNKTADMLAAIGSAVVASLRKTMLEILSLGAGVQSSAVLLMSIHGDLPKLDHAIFADTGWEPAAVYTQLKMLTGLAEEAGIKVHLVHKSNIKEDALDSQVRGKKTETGRWASMPYFTTDRESGKKGMIRRQCTYEYKIRPIEKCLRYDILGLKPRQRAPKEPVIRQWRGISVDEYRRVRASDHKFMTTWHPLVEKRITRQMCHEWMADHGYPVAPRSACIGCPFHHDDEWRHLKENSPDEWQEAVDFDESIRKCGGTRGDMFLHAKRIPLVQIDLDRKTNGDVQHMLWDDECSGMCGV